MPPDRRTFASPPRSPFSLSLSASAAHSAARIPSAPTHAVPSAPLLASSASNPSPSSHQALSISHSIHRPDPSISSYLADRHAQEAIFSSVLSKRQLSRLELQKRHQPSQRQLRIAHQEFHRQRELYQRQQLQQQQQHHHHHHHHHHMNPQFPDGASPQLQQQHNGTNSTSASGPSSLVSSTSRGYTSISSALPSSSFSASIPFNPSSSHHPPSQSSSPQPLPLRLHQHPEWAVVRKKERARLLSNMSTIRESLPIAPLPQSVAKVNLERLSQRLQHRRARARETILFDLHHGVKAMEAQVHKQVEMVLSRLKEAPGSRYAFALKNSFFSHIPVSLSNSLLPAGSYSDCSASTPSPSSSSSSPISSSTSSSTSSSSLSLSSLSSVMEMDGDFLVEKVEGIKRERERDRTATDTLSNHFNSIALAGLSATPESQSSIPTAISRGVGRGSQEAGHVSISGAGASEVLSASMHTRYSTACSQVLSAALPSFIPSMVAPLVCVFSYPVPPSNAQPNGGTRPHSQQEQHHEQDKDLVFPWGLPDRPPPPASVYMSPRQREQLQATPISEIVVLHSKSWTQAEREALYLATARFRLMGRWSKIREIMNLHRTDQEIETEYMKLYGPRDDIDVVDDEDEAEAERSYKRGYSSYTENDKENEDIGTMRMGEDRFGSMDGDADDEAEGPMFIKFRGARRAASTTSSSQEKRGQQEQNNSRVFKSVYEHQPILGPRPRPAILKEPIRLHKKELMIDKQFALEEIPMRL